MRIAVKELCYDESQRTVFARGGVRIVLSPTLVQGPGAALRLVDAIDKLEEVDQFILARYAAVAEQILSSSFALLLDRQSRLSHRKRNCGVHQCR